MIVAEAVVRATWSPEYQAIRDHFADRTAGRSGVSLMQGIDEGLVILSELDATEEAMRAFCLRPLFEKDDDLIRYGQDYLSGVDADPYVILLVMEFRSRANSWSPEQARYGDAGIEHSGPCALVSAGPVEAVKHMLIADKVLARKAFIRQHRATDAQGEARRIYYEQWLSALGVDQLEYDQLCAAVDLAS